MRTSWLLLLLTVFAGGCELDNSALPLVGTLERDRLELVAEAAETIVEVLVSEGQSVRAGDLLMRQEDAVRRVEVSAARAARDSAAQRLAELVRGPRLEQIREARARLTGARENLHFQADERKRIAQLAERNLASPSDLERQRNAQDLARAEVESLSAGLDALEAGTTSEELGQAQANLAEAEARLELAQINLSRLEIRATRDGRIDALTYKLGERPAPGVTTIVMLADQAPFARVYVPEPLRARIQPGMPAEIAVDGVEAVFAGRVRFVSADASFTPYYALTQRDRSRLAFLAEVTLTDADARALPSGVPVEVDFPALH